MMTIAKTQFVLVVVVSTPSNSRSSTIKCFSGFENGDQLVKFLVEFPSKILEFPHLTKLLLEEKYYSSSAMAKISDCYFISLKYVMDSLGISNLLTQTWGVSRTLIPALTGILVFSTIAYQRPDFTLLSKLFFITNPHLYSVIIAFNSIFAYALVKRAIDFSAVSINVLVGVEAADFFSKKQEWIINERIFRKAKLAARITILAAIEYSAEAQRHLRVHKRLLKPLESYFNPSEVENMDLLPGEFSHSDMLILDDKLDEFDEFSTLKGSVSIQTLLFLLVCKELRSSFDETIPDESPGLSEVERETETTNNNNNNNNNKFKVCKRVCRILAYRSPTLRPLARLGRLASSSSRFVKFAKTSHGNRMAKQQKRNVSYLEQCLQAKSCFN